MIRTSLVALLLAAPALAQAPAADWKAANAEMGKAAERGDFKNATGWAATALDRYRKAGAPNGSTLVQLAVTYADTAVRGSVPAERQRAIAALASLDTELARAGGKPKAGQRTYILRSLGQLRLAGGDSAGWRAALAQNVAATRLAFDPAHRQVAVALMELANATARTAGDAAARPSAVEAATIVGKLPANDGIRATVELNAAKLDLDAGRVDAATRRYDAIVKRLDPAGQETSSLWRAAAERLAQLHHAAGKTVEADALATQVIARTRDNKEPQPLLLATPQSSATAVGNPPPTAKVTFDVGPDGRPANVKATSVSPAYARLAEDAVRRSRFLPVIAAGKPQASRAQTIEFATAPGA